MSSESTDLSAQLARIKGAEVIKSFCYTCPWLCPTEVYVRDGRVVYHKGNPDAPNNIGTRCAKGMASWHITQDPDRLKYPMRRINPKDEPGRFERISWDDAFSFIAEKLTAIKEKWGPEAVVYLTHHDPNSAFMVSMLANLYGTPNISLGHVMGCEADRRVATLTLFGDIFPMHDFENSRYVMLWGMNIFGANQGLFESRGLADAQSRGCKLVVIDPSFTETAQKADEWIPIRPGTDGALALAMCRVIVDEDLFDRDFVNSHCSGFDGFRDHLRERGYTPEWAEPITGVAAETARRLALEFAITKPAMAALFRGPGYYTNGTDASRAIYLLDVLTGEVDKPGNLKLNEWAPLGPPVVIPKEARVPFGNKPLAHAMGYPLAPLTGYPLVPEVPNSRLPEAVLEDNPYPVRGIIAQATNPVMSDPNRDRVQEMFRNLELGIAIDLYMSETALECDIVLPETSFYEHAEIKQGMWMGPEVVLCQPAVAPVGESRPMYEIVKGIAEKMGWGQHYSYERWEDWGELMMKKVPISLDELKKKGFWAGEVHYNRVPAGLRTPSGKIEIHSKRFADAGQNPYPVYTDRSVLPDEDYPLQLTHSKLSTHCNIVTQNNPFLMEICGENWVEINTVDAAKCGVRNDTYVIVESPKDSIRIKAKVVEGLVPGCVSVRHGHGFGHWAMGSTAKGKGAHSNNLMDTHTNPVSGANTYNECKVRVRPA